MIKLLTKEQKEGLCGKLSEKPWVTGGNDNACIRVSDVTAILDECTEKAFPVVKYSDPYCVGLEVVEAGDLIAIKLDNLEMISEGAQVRLYKEQFKGFVEDCQEIVELLEEQNG